jgi:hypothetical protein
MAAGINDTFRQVGVAVGVAAWGAIFLGRGSSHIQSLVGGTPLAGHGRPRQLLEALTGGHLTAATGSLPPGARGLAIHATRDGFLTGLNAVLLIGGIVAVVGAVLALWLVREREIERDEAPSPARATGALEPTPA